MKILIVSDFHGKVSAVEGARERARLDKVSVIVVCGDITHFGSVLAAEKMLGMFAESGVPTIFVPGNCDSKELAEKSLIKGVHCLHGRHEKIAGVDFIGVGGSTPGPFDTPFEIEEETLSSLLNKAYQELGGRKRFVLISHVPPLNTKVDVAPSGVHAGSVAIREFIEETRPLLVACGHIHEARGVDEIDGVPIVNPGPAKWGLCALAAVNERVKVRLGRFGEKG